jgi:uncharacterized protein YdaU (DUF1376 family)
MQAMHYFVHNIGDYRRDTAHLSLLEHGAYRQLLDSYYLAEEPIPEETESVFRRLCARTEDEKSAVLVVLREFFVLVEGAYRHARCDREIIAYQQKAERARTNGKLGGRPPAVITEVVISGNPRGTQSKANQEPITINHKPHTKRQRGAPSSVGAETKKKAERMAEVMRATGLKAVSATHPQMYALLGQGVELAEFENAARLAVSKGKDFAYALGICKRLLRDGAVRSSMGSMASGQWDSGRASIEAAAKRVGIEPWDQRAFESGGGESFLSYTSRVRRKRIAEGEPG